MNPDLMSASVSLAFAAVLAIAMLAHLSQLSGKNRLLHGLYAATAAGLFYLFASKALGWSFIPREAWLAFYGLLFVVVAGLALRFRGREGAGVPWGGLLIEQAAMAYIFAPLAYWKPPLSALLLLYFLLELFSWMKGREEFVAEATEKSSRPPLFPAKRVRGVKEIAAAAAAAALVYVFAVGTGRAPVAPPPEEQQVATEQPAEVAAPADSGSAEKTATPEEPSPAEAAQTPAPAPSPAAPAEAPAGSYVAKAGDTLKSISRKLYGKANKLAALMAANPGVKPAAKLKEGQLIQLPPPKP